MGKGIKPRRTLRLIGKKSKLNKLEKPQSKQSKPLSKLGLEKQSYIQSNTGAFFKLMQISAV
jgi:hypothetical protein